MLRPRAAVFLAASSLSSVLVFSPSALVFSPSAFSIQPSPLREAPQIIRSTAALPAHVAGSFDDIAACHLTPEGDYLVFDRRAHAVYSVAGNTTPRKIIHIGAEPGRILRPLAFDSAADGTSVPAASARCA